MATMFYGVLDLATGVLRHSSAGHPSPVPLSASIRSLPVVPTPPLGSGWSGDEHWSETEHPPLSRTPALRW